MQPYKVLTYPNEYLTQKCFDVKEFGTPQLRELVQRMQATIRHKNSRGIGLAANQVGILMRVIVINTLERKSGGYLGALINPEIIQSGDDIQPKDEGCLSFPNQRYQVFRPNSITVRFSNIDGQEQTRTFKGITAICIQHEIDHLNGSTIKDNGTFVEEEE